MLALQAKVDHLSSEADNRVEYALWQQRQAHEKSLQELCALHAQELHEATVQVSDRPFLGQAMLPDRRRHPRKQLLQPFPACFVPAAGLCMGDGQDCCEPLLLHHSAAVPRLKPAGLPESCLHDISMISDGNNHARQNPASGHLQTLLLAAREQLGTPWAVAVRAKLFMAWLWLGCDQNY